MTTQNVSLFDALTEIHQRPEPFETYTAKNMWDDEHVSKKLLASHLDEESEPASRPHAFISKSADWIIDKFSLADGHRVADLGCGPGLYATRFAATGAAVTGIDFSRRSINYAVGEARKQGLSIDYVLGDYLEYRPNRKFDLITTLYCDLCALSTDQRRRLLEGFRDMLVDGGSILLDVFSLQAFAERQESTGCGFRYMDGFWAPSDYWGFCRTFKYDQEKVVLDKYTIIEPGRSRRIYNWLQYFSFDSLVKEFAECGLRIVERYSDLTGKPYTGGQVLAVIAQSAEFDDLEKESFQ